MSEIVGLKDSRLLDTSSVYDSNQSKTQKEINATQTELNKNISSRKPVIGYSGIQTQTISTINANVYTSSFTIPKGNNIVFCKIRSDADASTDLYAHFNVFRASDKASLLFGLDNFFFDTPNDNTTWSGTKYWHSAFAAQPIWFDEATDLCISCWVNIAITITWGISYINFGY